MREAVWDPVFVLEGVCEAPEEPLGELLRESVELLVSEVVPVKEALVVCVGVVVGSRVGRVEPVPEMDAV